jgi:DNA-binding response OmpR family regulator
MKIFLLEDDYSLNKIIKESLLQKNFTVQSCTDGYEAAKYIIQEPYDIYILDINVPGFNGHKILEILKQEHKELPVIIISASSNIESIEKSYNLGCNDYLKKPFDFEELYIRIKYLIKTVYQNNENDIIDLSYGFSFNLNTQKLYKHDVEIDLTKKEQLLLELFLKNTNSTVSIETIHEHVWGDKEVEPVSMRSIIHKLQKKLKNGMIVNIRGIGYKFLI